MAITDYLKGIDNATAGQKTDVTTATNDLSTLQTGAGALPAKLKEALNLKLNNNKDIINQQSETMQNYFNSGAQAREKYQDVWNPFEKAKLVQQDRSMALRPYDTLSGVLENRMGTVADTVKAGVEGWQGMVNAATTKLDTAKSMLSTALQSYLSAADQQQAADDMAYKVAAAEEASRQFELNYGLDVTKRNDQVSQFQQDLAARAAALRASGNADDAKKIETAAALANGIASNPEYIKDPSKAWQYIHSMESAWEKQGLDVKGIIWPAYTGIGGSSSAPTATTSTGWGNKPSNYSNTQLNLTTGQIPGNPVTTAPVLKPGDPGYVDASKLKYIQGQNTNPYGFSLGGK